MTPEEKKIDEYRVNCSFGKETDNPPANKVCRVPMDSFGPCKTQNGYNYEKGRPCIFLKLNKVSVKQLHVETTFSN